MEDIHENITIIYTLDISTTPIYFSVLLFALSLYSLPIFGYFNKTEFKYILIDKDFDLLKALKKPRTLEVVEALKIIYPHSSFLKEPEAPRC